MTASPTDTRARWVSYLLAIARPVLEPLSRGMLRQVMPIESRSPREDRAQYTYLEAFGRALCGLAPWLGCPGLTGEEERLRLDTLRMTREALAQAVDPQGPDAMNFSQGYQPIVDAAFLCQGLLRAYDSLYLALPPDVQRQLILRLKATRTRKPYACNWLLFSAIIEVFLRKAGEKDWDPMRIDYALRQHEQWYLGDGVYGDGPEFHFDYYNSFVIGPMLVDILREVAGVSPDWDALAPGIRARAIRYGAILERMISPEGAFPVIGRSMAYRFGAMHHLAQMALLDMLADGVTPAQVRCALDAVICRILSAPGVFDAAGYLTVGFCGHQPDIGEAYISTGSTYLCSTVFLPLGLPPEAPFWRDADAPWSSVTIWGGQNTAADHHLSTRRNN